MPTADFTIDPHEGGTALSIHYSYKLIFRGRAKKGDTDTQMKKGIGGMAKALQRESERIATYAKQSSDLQQAP
ncbi:MAG: hypothetical protein P8L30_07085 [Longimicrobiales bacterium]|nr:hypothetical protein [Longimicrobiales bacterium]